MRRLSLIGSFVLACVATAGAQKAPNAGAVAKLEANRTKNPNSVPALRALGVAYFKLQRYDEARPILESAQKLDPKDGVSALYAGLTAEALKDYAAAKTAYQSYLNVGKTKGVRNDIAKRLVSVSKLELQAAAKAAIANESRVAQQPGSPRTIAVMPMKFTGTDTTLQPLERGVADLLITDLSRSSQLTVVERDRMQAIVDEIALASSGAVDQTTAVRGGRITRAGRVVQGGIVQTGGQRLSLSSSVVDVPTSAQVGRDASAQGALDQLFTLEKTLAFGVFDALGITLTAAERQLVEQRPTRNVQAFLAYSRGLLAEDKGRFDEAARYFENAQSLDPAFAGAAIKAQNANSAVQGAAVTATKVETGLKSSAEGQTVQAAERGTTTVNQPLNQTLANTVQSVNPTTTTTVTSSGGSGGGAAPPPARDASTQTTGTDQPATRTGTVTIVIRRP
ncbi:MAG: tetratricopeptide repeat protein [Gemmatimonadaceae bacterium]|nr:tetratricopeptide repeat protein [Gemmatimonadaceae bacterium]